MPLGTVVDVVVNHEFVILIYDNGTNFQQFSFEIWQDSVALFEGSGLNSVSEATHAAYDTIYESRTS